jgi:probable LLM family oxidoreductase
LCSFWFRLAGAFENRPEVLSVEWRALAIGLRRLGYGRIQMLCVAISWISRRVLLVEIGIDSFAAAISDPVTGETLSAAERLRDLLAEMELADRVGLDVFGIGEHHRAEFLDSAPAVILAAAAARTKNIRLTSAVTVLSAADPVRVFQEFATLDLISQGRAEIVAGRGSFVESYPLFGLQLEDYDSLFTEKLELLLAIRDNTNVHWSGKHRAALTGQGIYPRPLQNPLPIWVGVGGTPASFVRAGMLGLPLMVAIIGGETHRFRPLVDLYREAGRRAGHPAEKLKVGLHSIGFLADTTQKAADDFFPGYAHTFTEIGKERGWSPTTRAQFDATRGPTGALIIGDAETVTKKILHVNEALGGISRITFQMGVSTVAHEKMLRAIEILGTEVAPMVRKQIPSIVTGG